MIVDLRGRVTEIRYKDGKAYADVTIGQGQTLLATLPIEIPRDDAVALLGAQGWTGSINARLMLEVVG